MIESENTSQDPRRRSLAAFFRETPSRNPQPVLRTSAVAAAGCVYGREGPGIFVN
ncbi:MAG: hypothetical protein P8179_04405 [Candidatus Thiodiazotropha sp.]|jgi:hypothetical protein